MMLSRCIPLVFATGLGMAQSAYSQQVQIIEEINPGEFVDISQIGTPLGLGHDDVVDAGPFSGNFLLLPGRMLIGVNGGVGFGFDSPDTNGVELSGHNSSIPSNAFQGHQALLPYWDDLGDEIDDKNGDVYMARLAEPGRTMTIVQWDNLPLRKNPEDTVTFQVKIFDNQNPTGVYAQFIYADVEQPGASGGIGATIGYQDGSANFSDLQQSFDTAGAVSNGTVLSIVIEHRLGLESQAIPTVSEWGLIIMALLLLTGGTLIFCRGARRAHAFPGLRLISIINQRSIGLSRGRIPPGLVKPNDMPGCFSQSWMTIIEHLADHSVAVQQQTLGFLILFQSNQTIAQFRLSCGRPWMSDAMSFPINSQCLPQQGLRSFMVPLTETNST